MRGCLLVGLLLGPGAASASERVLVANQVRSFQGPVDAPLVMPTAVAVGPQGQVWVADGVNDRVVEFAATGELLSTVHTVDGLALRNPVGIDISDDGTVWIADSGNRRVAVLPPPPALQRTVSVDSDLLDGLDLTDLAVSGDGQVLWLVDNDGHRVLRGQLGVHVWEPIGTYGEGIGQLRHPFRVDLAEDGTAWISDALNARIASVSDAGQPRRAIGRYGVAPGQVHRPGGVAVADDRIWVADSSLGVIQAFSPGGRLIDVLRDTEGRILHLDSPSGLAIDGDRLFVVELRAGRVLELEIGRQVGRPLQGSPPTAVTATGSGGQECTMCHLELIPTLARGLGNLLVDPPLDSATNPYVSTEGACLTCHDGAVMDSRKAVWAMHGHPIGEPPPDDMKIPAELPLLDGAMACRTCHSAHTAGGSGQVHRDALMLRVSETAEELCIACHGDMMAEEGR